MGESFEENYPLDQFPDGFNSSTTSSAMDCTGLIPSAPQSEAELEAYEELYPFMPVQNTTTDQNAETQK